MFTVSAHGSIAEEVLGSNARAREVVASNQKNEVVAASLLTSLVEEVDDTPHGSLFSGTPHEYSAVLIPFESRNELGEVVGRVEITV